jgi:hypothetical protein
MDFLSPSVLYFFIILKWGQSICMYHTRDDICLKFYSEGMSTIFYCTLN